MTLIGTVQNCDWRELARRVRDEVGQVDALIVDAPYSERTHSAHDSASEGSEEDRRSLDYEPWSAGTVVEFVDAWAPLVSGWIFSITDHELAPRWAEALERIGRYAFSPLACVQPGRSVRIMGDGPAQWSTWGIAARPRGREFARWGALPGAYVVPRGRSDRSGVVGGKPLWLMERIVEDYTRPGDLVCDPCAGGGTTLLAAKLLCRRWVGSDIDEAHVEIARERLRDLPSRPKAGTLALFGGGE